MLAPHERGGTSDALARITGQVSETTGRQYVLRVKSLLSYAQRLGYATFNAGATIKVKSDTRNRGANLAKRIISEVDVALVVRGARTKRDRVLLEVLYAAGLRVLELVALTWSDVQPRDKGQQLSVVGKGGVVRQLETPTPEDKDRPSPLALCSPHSCCCHKYLRRHASPMWRTFFSSALARHGPAYGAADGLALWHMFDTAHCERGPNLVEHRLAHVPMAAFGGDRNRAADLQAVQGARRDAGGLRELDHRHLRERPRRRQLPPIEHTHHGLHSS